MQVHRSHVRLFKSLRLRRAQKEGLAELWYAWVRRRHALDQEVSAALSLLATSLPSQAPWEHSVLAATGAQHDAAGTACTMHQIAAGQHVSSVSMLLTLVEAAEACTVEDLEGSRHNPPAPIPGVDESRDGASPVRDMHASCRQQDSHACEVGGLHGTTQEGAGVGLLGASAEGMAAAQQALSALRDVHSTDDLMLRDYSAYALLPTWGISEVQYPCCAALRP